MKESVAIICKCSSKNKLFGIRFDELSNTAWEYAWAFPLKDGADKRESGYSTTIKGQFLEGEDYPGCPHCKNKGFFGCSCGKISCWDTESMYVHCYHCGQDIELNDTLDEITATGGM